MMKSTRFLPFAPVCGALSLAFTLAAFGQNTGFYFRGDIGATITHDNRIKEFFGPTTGTEVEFDPGVRLSAAGGYRVVPWFGVELETGFLHNPIESITGATFLDASLSHVPTLVNVVFQLTNETRFVSYIGAGAGADSSILEIDRSTFGTSFLDGRDADVVFAYQGFAGFSYRVNRRISVGVIYKFFGTEEPRWEVRDLNTGARGRLGFGAARTHSVGAAVTVRF